MGDKEGGVREEEGVDKGGRLMWKRRVGDKEEDGEANMRHRAGWRGGGGQGKKG